MKNNYIAISVWEIDNPKTLLHDIESIKHTHPGWKIILYHDQSIGGKTIAELENFEVILVDMSSTDMHPSLWKFQAANLPDMGYAIFRDSESGIDLDPKGWPKHMQLPDTTIIGFDGENTEMIANNKNSAVLSYICTLLTPVVELRRLIGGF